jgi:hypothetical protein
LKELLMNDAFTITEDHRGYILTRKSDGKTMQGLSSHTVHRLRTDFLHNPEHVADYIWE